MMLNLNSMTLNSMMMNSMMIRISMLLSVQHYHLSINLNQYCPYRYQGKRHYHSSKKLKLYFLVVPFIIIIIVVCYINKIILCYCCNVIVTVISSQYTSVSPSPSGITRKSFIFPDRVAILLVTVHSTQLP